MNVILTHRAFGPNLTMVDQWKDAKGVKWGAFRDQWNLWFAAPMSEISIATF